MGSHYYLAISWTGFWGIPLNYGAMQHKVKEKSLEMQNKGLIFVSSTKVII